MKSLEELLVLQDSDYLKLEVRVSQIPGSGLGLFAVEMIEPEEVIGEYRGPVISSEHCYSPCFDTEDKMVYISSEYSVIGTQSVVSRANDIVKYEPHLFNTPLYKLFRKMQQLPTHQQF